MFVSEEEHDSAWVVKLVHGIEVGDSIDVADVYDGKVLDALGDLVEDLVLPHAVGVVVAPETQYLRTLKSVYISGVTTLQHWMYGVLGYSMITYNKSFVFRKYGLVDVPAGFEVGEDDGTHFCVALGYM